MRASAEVREEEGGELLVSTEAWREAKGYVRYLGPREKVLRLPGTPALASAPRSWEVRGRLAERE